MRQIRRSCFETNSSSSHSLVVRSDEIVRDTEDTEYYTHDEMRKELWLTKDGVLDAHDENWYFGRAPFRPLFRFVDKFEYAIANCHSAEEKDSLCALLKELVPEVTDIILPQEWGAGVDEYCLSSWLHKCDVDMKEFLTNKKYVIIQDGDEYYIWSDLVKLGIIDKKAAGIACEDESDEK